MSQIYENISKMMIKRLTFNSMTSAKNKEEIGFIDMIKTMKTRELY